VRAALTDERAIRAKREAAAARIEAARATLDSLNAADGAK
jgi:hypothetical protein